MACFDLTKVGRTMRGQELELSDWEPGWLSASVGVGRLDCWTDGPDRLTG